MGEPFEDDFGVEVQLWKTILDSGLGLGREVWDADKDWQRLNTRWPTEPVVWGSKRVGEKAQD